MAEQARSLKVFVSYSRADVGFADQLVLALEDKGFEPILDRHDISGAENWRERLGKLILSADAVAFVLTAKSAASEICSWEVNEAVRLGKRIIPVTPGSIDGVTPPPALGELNWTPFYADPAIPGSGFYYGVKRLVEALSIDLDWLRAQTRYSERALEWAKEKPEDLLLRGEALKEAEGWSAQTPAGSHPPELVREYLAASGDAEQHRQAAAKVQLAEREQALKTAEAAVADSRTAQGKLRRFTQWALGGGVVLLLIAVVGNFFAVTTTLDASDRRAALFATAANQLTQVGDYRRALLVALSGDPAARTGMIESLFRPGGNPSARAAMVRAYSSDKLVSSTPVDVSVVEMAALADGHRFVTFHNDGTVRMWDAALDTPLLPGPQGATPFIVSYASALPDGDHFALGWTEAGAEMPALWSVSTKKVDRQFELDHSHGFGATSAVALSSNGKYLAAGFDRGLVIWDTAKTAPLHVKAHDSFHVTALAVSDDGETVVAASYDGALVWRPEEDGVVGPVEDDNSNINSLVIFEQSQILAGLANGQLGIISPQTAKVSDSQTLLSQDLSGDEANGIERVALSPDGRLFYLLTSQGQLRVLRITTGFDLDVAGSQRGVTHSVFLPDAYMFVTASKDGFVRTWRATSAQRSAPINDELRDRRNRIGMTEGGVVTGSVGEEQVFRWMPGAARPEFAPAPGGALSLVFTRDASVFAFTTDKGVSIHRFADDKPIKTIPAAMLTETDAPPQALYFLPDGKRLLVVTEKSEASLWSLDQQARLGPIAKLEHHSRLAISPDGSWIATGLTPRDGGLDFGVAMDVIEMMQVDRYSIVTIWDVASGASQRIPIEGNVSTLAIHPDGARLAYGLDSGGMGLLQKGEASPRQVFTGHTKKPVEAIVFDVGGGLLLSSGEDGSVKLWQIGEREALERFETFGSYTVAGVFDPDGKHVIGIDDDRIVRWPVSPIVNGSVDDQMKVACQRLEARGVAGFTAQDKLEMTFLDDVASDPCRKLGFTRKVVDAKKP